MRTQLLGFIVACCVIIPSVPLVHAQPGIIEEHWYHSYASLTAQINEWENSYPEFVKVVSAGQTELGREQWVVQISDWANDLRPDGREKTIVYIDGGHHGNEHLGTELAFLVAEFYIEESANQNEEALNVIAETEIHVMIMLNADGNDMDTRWNINQIDLNRNYDHMWTEEETQSGRGGPFSEAETRNNADYMTQYVSNADLYVTMHTGVWVLAYPWGWTGDMPSDWELFTHIADHINENIEPELPVRNANAGIYPTHGTSRDYGYGVMGFPTFTFETDDEQWLPGTIEPLSQRLGVELEIMRFLVSQADAWRAHLTIEQLDVTPTSVKGVVTNSAFASTANATLQYLNEDGTVAWTSPIFGVNATNSTEINFKTPERLNNLGSWNLNYQVRVVEVSRWVNESISSDVISFTERSDDAFLVGYGIFNSLSLVVGFIGLAYAIRPQDEPYFMESSLHPTPYEN